MTHFDVSAGARGGKPMPATAAQWHCSAFANRCLNPIRPMCFCVRPAPFAKSGRSDSNRRRPAWEAGILPLNYSRLLFTGRQNDYKPVFSDYPGDNTHLQEKQYTTARQLVSGFGTEDHLKLCFENFGILCFRLCFSHRSYAPANGLYYCYQYRQPRLRHVE